MKVTLHKNFNPQIETFTLTKTEIEDQAIQDLIRYKKLYFERYHKLAATTLDIDNFVQELWGISIVFEKIDQTIDGKKILGKLEPDDQKIIIDDSARANQRSISFTIAHEAGHLSLHASMFRLIDGVVAGWAGTSISDVRINRLQELHDFRKEWQADHYAAALLAPEIEIIRLLHELGLANNNDLTSPVDMQIYGGKFDQKFNLSRQALEIRFSELGIPVKNSRYIRFNK